MVINHLRLTRNDRGNDRTPTQTQRVGSVPRPYANQLLGMRAAAVMDMPCSLCELTGTDGALRRMIE